MSIKCGSCKETHEHVQDVRHCYGMVTDAHEMGQNNLGAIQEVVRQQVATAPRPSSQSAKNARVDLSGLEAGVMEGRFAVSLDGETKLRFFQVDKPTTGKWKGYTFVKEQASDELWPVRSPTRRGAILKAIVDAGPMEAMLTYGRELGKCGHCGRTLTDEASREAGIGPVCAGKF